jgi:GT2 family glycosyltransferase
MEGFSVTANLFCSREVFDRVGGFAVGVPEDMEWCHRARAAGFRLGYAAAAVVGHPARRTWAELEAKWRRLGAESFALMQMKPRGRLRWLARSWALPLSAVAHTPRLLADKRLHSFPARLAALATLYRLRFWRFIDAHRLLASRGGK